MKVLKAVKAAVRKSLHTIKAVGRSVGIAGGAGGIVGPSKKRMKKASSTQLSRVHLEKMLADSYVPNSLAGPIGTYALDPTLSDNRVKVYYDPSSKHTVVAHRGSATKADWFENGLYAGGIKAGSNFKHSGEIQRQAEKKYGSSNLTTIGHSKGALHAQEFGQHGDIVTLNKPVNIKDSLLYKVPKYQTDYRGEGDVVSALRPIQRGNSAVTLHKDKKAKGSLLSKVLAEHSTETLQRDK